MCESPPTTLTKPGAPEIKIEVGKDTATFEGKPRPSVALTFRNAGEPFTLVARAQKPEWLLKAHGEGMEVKGR